MGQRILSTISLLLGLALTASPGSVAGQPPESVPPPNSPREHHLDPLATELPPPPRAIASSHEPAPAEVRPIPLPDDGLSGPPLVTKGAPAAGVDPLVCPAALRSPTRPAAQVVSAGLSEATPSATGTTSVSVEVTGPAAAGSGQPLRFQLLLRCGGTAGATNLRVEQELPDRARLVGADPMPEVRGRCLVWSLGDLAVNAERRLSFEVQPDGPGTLPRGPSITYSAAWGGKPPDPPSLTLTQTLPLAARQGEQVPIRLRVANRGPAPLTGVKVTDQLPPGLTHPQGARLEADLGTLAPGQVKELRLDAVAARAGCLTNEAVATADGGLACPSRGALDVTPAKGDPAPR